MNKKYSVFVSSTYEDLKEERQEVVNALLQMDCFPVGMEYFNASDQSQWDVIKSLIDECDYYVLIIAGRYGSVEPKSGKSYTQLEYEYARSIGVPTIAFLYNNPENLPNKDVEKEHVDELNSFKEEVKKHMVKYWSSPTNLSGQVVLSLNQLFKTHKRIGWIRADEKSSAEQNKELLRLREENEKLQKKIHLIEENAPEGTEDLCQGEDEFEIHVSGNLEFFTNENFVYKMTWNEICRVVLPHLVSSCWENEMKESMENYICDKYPNFSKININDYSFQIIKIQLMALGLMTMVSSTKSKSNLALWTLTKYGHNMLLRLNALRRYEEITR
jgi:hypothetical protein